MWKLLGTPGDERPVVLLCGNKSVEDILLKEELSAWSKQAAGRLKVVHVVGNGPDDPAPAGWVDTPEYTAETGWIDKAKIEKYCFPPAEDTLLFVCGLPPMYKALCGPREEKELVEGLEANHLAELALIPLRRNSKQILAEFVFIFVQKIHKNPKIRIRIIYYFFGFFQKLF